jgi:hypothetical protein
LAGQLGDAGSVLHGSGDTGAGGTTMSNVSVVKELRSIIELSVRVSVEEAKLAAKASCPVRRCLREGGA